MQLGISEQLMCNDLLVDVPLVAPSDVHDSVALVDDHTIVDEAMLRRATRLKAIISPTTGLNHIDMNAADNNNYSRDLNFGWKANNIDL